MAQWQSGRQQSLLHGNMRFICSRDSLPSESSGRLCEHAIDGGPHGSGFLHGLEKLLGYDIDLKVSKLTRGLA